MPRKLKFRVIHASGQDEVHKASNLNIHSPGTTGWQSSKFCFYPQDIIVQLENKSRLRKIQLLSHQSYVATKIEFYVGDVADGTDMLLPNVRYVRLGYISLSDNEKTNYEARELKSVHVDAVGNFLKLRIHKNHMNQFNLCNQVGIIAINLIGDELGLRHLDMNDPDVLLNGQGDLDPILSGIINKPDYISPLDDLAFDMYQDPEIAQIIRRLDRKKQEAVLQERYEYAKKLKSAITELQKAGEKLGKMEVEKKQAVENEDYDKARMKKAQMDDYRLQIYREYNLNDLLEVTGTRHPQPIDLEPTRQPTPPRLDPLPRSPYYDEQPIRSKPFVEGQGQQTNRSDELEREEDKEEIDESARTPYDERRLPVHKNKPHEVDEPLPLDPDLQQDVDYEPMTEVDMREASVAIDVFGYDLVSKAYSKTWSYREDALTSVHRQLEALPSGNRETARSQFKAAVFLSQKGIDDKVFAVFTAALNLLRMLLTDFVTKHRIPKSDISSGVEKCLQSLFHKAGDTAVRNRDVAKNFVVEMANFPEVKTTNAVPHECVKIFKLTLAPRHAQSRCELVESLYMKFGLKNGLTLKNVMKFNVEALQHNAGEVRDVVERLIKQMYQDHGAPVKDYLPPDDEKTRKNTLWRQLFEYFDEVDGKPSKTDLKRKKAEDELKKQAEIDALQKQLQELRDMNAGKAPVNPSALKGNPNAKRPVKKKPEPNKPKGKNGGKKEETDSVILNVDQICMFCGRKDEHFDEERLDVHYWKFCPMLKRCKNCLQVVEISTYTDHVLEECEEKDKFGKCPRCTEAFPKTQLKEHIAEKSCKVAKSSMSHCPLCHENIPPGEQGWKDHLMGKVGCEQNTRRIPALSEPKLRKRDKPYVKPAGR